MNVFLCLLAILLTGTAHAATVMKVKDGKVLAEGSMDNVRVGDNIALTDADGKVTGMGRVSQIKNRRAILELVSGQAEEGGRAEANVSSRSRSVSSTDSAGESSSRKDDVFHDPRRRAWGISLGKVEQRMNVTFTTGSVQLIGDGFHLSGFFEPLITGPVHWRAFSGFTNYKLTGTATTASCENSTSCGLSASFINAGLETLLPIYETRHYRLWVSASGRADIPLTTSTNAVQQSGLTIASSVAGTAGADWKFDFTQSAFLGFSKSQSLLSSEVVSSTGLTILTGYSKAF